MSYTPLHVHSIFSENNRLISNGCLEFDKTSIFIKKHKDKSSFMWKYCNVAYENYDSLISLTCPVHGIQPPKRAEYLLKGSGCKKCAVSKIKKKELSYFILKAEKIHNNKYDYSLIKDYSKASDIVEIICPIHGVFKQRLSSHCSGQGCPSCGIIKNKLTAFDVQRRITLSSPFVSLKFDTYSDVTNSANFECSKHGVFTGVVNSILNNSEICPDCGYETTSKKNTRDYYSYLSEANIIHKNKYDYSKFYPLNSKELSTLICPIHGEFNTSWNYHVHNRSGCPKCGMPLSLEENNIFEFVNSILNESFEIKSRFKPDFLNGKELDIYIPDKKIAIEYNGSYWHSDQFRDRFYHFNKWKLCKENNVTLLNIWDFYWKIKEKQEIYKSKISHLLGLDKKIYARKCTLKNITNLDAKNFYLNNHLDGCGILYSESSSVGLFYDDILVMSATYGKFYSQSEKIFKWKLQRICTLMNHSVIGGISKISNYIKNTIGDFQFQITLDTGGLLTKGTPSEKDVSLRYWWVNDKLNFLTRNQCQVSKLKLNDDWANDDTEKTYMSKNKYYRVWDSGIITIDTN